MSKKSKILPLNPTQMPSHNSNILTEKYALQFAEEEYMAELIYNNHEGNSIIIIGDIHAERLDRLLNKKGLNSHYTSLAPITPDDIISKSLRYALEGTSEDYISMSWLKQINQDLNQIMGLPKNTNVQEACWDDEFLYTRYLKLAKSIMKKHNADNFKISISNQTKKLADKIKTNNSNKLIKNYNALDHPTFLFPYNINLAY